MVDRRAILNAFKPNSEIEHPAGFAGRQTQVRQLTDALLTDRSCPVIYGDRGLGKTSLALQLARIALGDTVLLEEIGAGDSALSEADTFVPFWISCSDATRTKDDVLQRIINSAEGYRRLEDLEKRVPSTTTSRRALKLKIFEAETIEQFKPENGRFMRLNIEDQLLAVVDTLAQDGIERVLFIIDELDRVANTDGLANFIKNASSPRVRIMLVGIGNTLSSLLRDHESIERNLVPVAVGRMSRAELAQIIDKTTAILHDEGADVAFSDPARQRLVAAAAGFPWFIHVLGQEALRRVWDEQRREVQDDDVQAAIESLANSRFAQQFSDLYQMAVRDSYNREIVLRLMAKWGDNDVPLSEIYPLAKDLGVTNPSICKKDLILKRYGSIMVAPPEHEKGVVRFTNNMFKRYISLRSSLYTDAKQRVDQAWTKKHG